LLYLVKYIHLNPVKAKIPLSEIGSYLKNGQSAVRKWVTKGRDFCSKKKMSIEDLISA